MSSEDKDRNLDAWGEASLSQETPKIVSKAPEGRREPGTDTPSQPQKDPYVLTP